MGHNDRGIERTIIQDEVSLQYSHSAAETKVDLDASAVHFSASLTLMPPSNTIKIAIVGSGLIGPRHGEAILNVPETELACVVDPNPAAQAAADKLECPLYPSVQAMLASSEKPDAALVCTPNHTHVSVARELLDAGLHVLCEKPISVDVASGQELVIRAASCSPRQS